MVSSINKDLGQFPTVIRMQEEAGQEMVIDLKPMLERCLDRWAKQHGGRYSKRIIIYRDGVSESQYKTVIAEELPLLEAACINKCGQDRPKITLIVVGKRHHTRLFQKKGNEVDNPDFGTVVDTGVTHDAIWDFFLQSHQTRAGTARPAHYIVLKDEIFTARFKPVDAVHKLENLTNAMCQLNGRALLPVGIVPAAHYADLACNRAKAYVDRHYFLNPDAPFKQEHLKVHPRLAEAMIYI